MLCNNNYMVLLLVALGEQTAQELISSHHPPATARAVQLELLPVDHDDEEEAAAETADCLPAAPTHKAEN
jgi:hypothetical protein